MMGDKAWVLAMMVFVVLADGRLVEWTGSSTEYLLPVSRSTYCDDKIGRYCTYLVGWELSPLVGPQQKAFIRSLQRCEDAPGACI